LGSQKNSTASTVKVKAVKRQLSETQAVASAAVKQANAEVNDAQAGVKNSQFLINERDNAITNLKLQREREIAMSVSAAVDKEKASVVYQFYTQLKPSESLLILPFSVCGHCSNRHELLGILLHLRLRQIRS
jgi:hypothetical protein